MLNNIKKRFSLFTSLIYKPGSKYNMPIFIPRFLVSNFALVLLAITLYSFNLYRTHVSGFDNLNYLVVIFLISICLIIVFYVTTNLTKIPAFIISSTSMCLVAYSNLIVKKLSINEMFTDIDIYQYQYPLSIFQFNQVQEFGSFLSWNPFVGAGIVLEGLTGTNYFVRELIFFFSPSVTFATNLYFFFHIILSMFFLSMFLERLGFSNLVAIIGSFIFLTCNQVITWSPFIHYPAFLLSFSMLNFGLIISNKNKKLSFFIICISFYICSAGSHLQNLSYIYIYSLIIIIFSSYKYFKINNLINLKSAIFSIISGTFISLYFVLPFFELINNVGDRNKIIDPRYLNLENLKNIFNSRILTNQNELIWDFDINIQLFISSAIIIIFLFLKTDKKHLESYSLSFFVVICFFAFDNPLQQIISNNIPGFSLISNWQRIAPFLIFSIIIFLCCKLDYYLKIDNRKFVRFVILFSIILSSFTRVNVFYNVETQLRSSQLHENYVQLKSLGNELKDFSIKNSRILSICNTSTKLPLVELSTLYVSDNLYWAGLYDSFPNKFYANKFKSISDTFPGDSGGRYYTHVKGDNINLDNLSNLNIEYVIVPKDCNINHKNLIQIKELDNYFLYKNNKNEPIINLGITNGEYVIPFIIDRNNHVEIYIETSEDNSNEFLYFNEIYNQSWSAKVNGINSIVINNDGFMKIKINKGANKIIFNFNNKDFSKHLNSLKEFLFEN